MAGMGAFNFIRFDKRAFGPVLALLIVVFASASCSSGKTPPEAAGAGQAEAAPPPSATGAEHSDHHSRHGGEFFMALDGEHHLEGTLTAPGILRIYLYNSRTQPLAPEKVGETKGVYNWGDTPEPPGKALKISSNGLTLEARLDKPIKFPVTLAVTLLLPRTPTSDGNPEIFTFSFDRYSEDPGQPAGSTSRTAATDHPEQGMY